MRRFLVLIVVVCVSGLAAGARPAAQNQPRPESRALVVGIEVDRDGARVKAYTAKERPFAPAGHHEAWQDPRTGAIPLEVALL